MYNWKLKKTVIPWQKKYHHGPGGIDPALQETYPLSAVLRHADAKIHDVDEDGKDVKDPRDTQGPLFPSPAFSGLFKK